MSALFTVSTNLPQNKLQFGGHKPVEMFLKPEDTGKSIVSTEFDFGALKPVEERWNRFADKLKGLLEQDKNPTSLSDNLREHPGRNQIRVTFSSTGPLSKKLKLLSNISLRLPNPEREQGCLVKLARLCGPHNVELIVSLSLIAKGDDKVSLHKLVWNEDDLLWEAEEEITFRKVDIRNIGKDTAQRIEIEIRLQKIELLLKDGGVNRVLQQIYGKPGDNRCTQRMLLMAEAFTDLVIISNHASAHQTPIKCHKFHLAGASRTFAKMITDSSATVEVEALQTPIIKLPESEPALRAMLHFIYYGGTDAIYGNGVNLGLVLELLEAGQKYELPNLVEVTNFVLSVRSTKESFSVERAVELCCYLGNLEEELWRRIKKRAFEMLSGKPIDQLMKSKDFVKIYEIACKLGPVFVSYFSKLKYFHKVEEYVPYSKVKVSKEEAGLIYEFLCSGEDYLFPRNLDLAVGMIILAEFCDRKLPPFVDWISTRFFGDGKIYKVDYLVDLFCLARCKEQEAKYWRQLKMGAARKLKIMMIEQPLKIEQSFKYQDMLRTNAAAADELRFMEVKIHQECVECCKRRRLHYKY